MSQPVPPRSAQPAPAAPADPSPAAEAVDEPAPMNRAARRARAKKAEPTHVGPRAGLAREGRGGRPHSKRPR